MMESKSLRLEFVIDDPAMPPDTFMVADFTGNETISQPFRFEVNLVSYEPALSLTDVANKPATLEIYRGDEQLVFHGQVAHFDQGVHVGDRYGYTAVLVPKLWFLSMYFQSRIFRDLTAPEIIEKVLKDAGFSSNDYAMLLQDSGVFPTREYCVQYQETDLNFINRLSEEEGLRYYFDMSEDKVFFSDKPIADSPFIPGDAPLVFNPGGGLEAAAEAVRDFGCREQIVAGKVVLKDYNYRTPEELLESESQLNTEMPGLHYEFGQHFKTIAEGDRLAKMRNEEIECRRRVLWGESGYVGMRAGHLFTLEQHFRDDFNEDYLLTTIEHHGTQGASVPGLGNTSAVGSAPYLCHFRCVRTDKMYRPPRLTPTPRIPGIMSGRIETTGGDYAHIDELGRYKTKMYFDRAETEDAEATHWIREKQDYSGPEYGYHFPHHKDTEAVWACVDGDPDRPMMLGTGPNPSNKSPVINDNHWQNVLRTWSGNQMIMDDKVDEEWIQINTPAENVVRLDDKDDYILASTTNKHQVLLDDKNRLILVQTTDGHFLKMDDENKKITLQSKDGHYMFIDDENEMISIADKDTKHHFTIDIANKKMTIETVDGDIDILAEEGHIEIRAKTLHTETTGDTTHQAANIHANAGGEHTIEATKITQTASAEYAESAPKIASNADATNDVTAGATTTIKGGMVMIN